MVNKIENQTKKRQARTTESIGVKLRKNKGIKVVRTILTVVATSMEAMERK